MMTIAIVGLGLMGGSFAKAFKKQGFTIYGYDSNIDAIRYGFEHQIIDSGSTFASDVLPSCPFVFLCLNPSDSITFMKKNKDLFKEYAIITDISGIKRHLVDEITPHLRSDIDFIFGHPIAGRESSGIAASDDSIFQGANYILCPTPTNRPEHLLMLENLLTSIGFRQVTHVSADEHDNIIAFTSQLTHIIALAIVNANPKGVDLSKFIGDSYRDLTRIAVINQPLWTELFLGNKEHLLTQIEHVQSYLKEYYQAIKNNDEATLHQLMSDATTSRKKI